MAINDFYKILGVYGQFDTGQSVVGLTEGFTKTLKYGSKTNFTHMERCNRFVYATTITASWAAYDLGAWSDLYNYVTNVNEAISNLNKYSDFSDETTAEFLGQLYFFRGFLYFELMKRYKEVIIYDENLDKIEANTPLSTEEEGWDIVESAFKPFAYSHGRASGIWQFIPATGRRFGLKQNWWYDGRRDVYASTIAAYKLLTKLQKQFKGDWLLALAAYNSGERNVHRAVRNNKRKGKPTDFWNLKLPAETRAYVPKLLALKRIIAEPEKYNVQLTKIENTPYFEKVDTKSQIDLARIAELSELPLDNIYKLK